jgi:prolyl oligopeptidase
MNKKIIPLLALTACTAFDIAAQPQYPATRKMDQTDDYFSHKIADPYRWLENDTAAETEAWVKEENKITQDYLSKIPFRSKIHNRLTELWNYTRYSAPQKEGEWFVFSKNDGLQNQSVMYIQKGLDGKPEVLLDPNKLSADGTVSIQAMAMSKNQKFFAYAVSASGSDWQEIYTIDLATRRLLKEKIEYVKFTSMSWAGDEGFYYSGYDRPEDEKTKFSAKTEYQKIFFHKIGTPQSADKLIYEDKEHPLRYVGAGLTEDERFLILSISEGTDGSEIKVRDMKNRNNPAFITLVPGFKTNADVVDNIGSNIILKTNSNAPMYKVVLVNPASPAEANWKTIIPEQKEPIKAVGTGGGKLFASYLKDANTQVNQYTLDGRLEHKIELPGLGTAEGFGCRKEDDFFFYSFTSFTYPPSIFKYDIKTGKSELYRKPDVKFDPQAFETKQVFYPSKDGTKVPMFITYKKGLKLDGSNPTLLYAYGGFNINITPAFSVSNIVFIENGGVYCVANLRGGGEYGEDWHKGGMLEKKQNVFDDFISAAEYLIIYQSGQTRYPWG